MVLFVGLAGGDTDTSRDYEYTDWDAVVIDESHNFRNADYAIVGARLGSASAGTVSTSVGAPGAARLARDGSVLTKTSPFGATTIWRAPLALSAKT